MGVVLWFFWVVDLDGGVMVGSFVVGSSRDESVISLLEHRKGT